MGRNAIILTGQGHYSNENQYNKLFQVPRDIYQVRFYYNLRTVEDQIFSRDGIDALIFDDLLDWPDRDTAEFIVRMKDERLAERMKVAVCSSQIGESLSGYASLGIQYFIKPIDQDIFRRYFGIVEPRVSKSAESRIVH